MAAALCAATLALSACSDDPPEPKPLDPPSSSASATASGSTTPPTDDAPVEPTMPAAAKKLTEPGAKAFVRYYFQVLTYAMQTGDTATLRALGKKGCRSCAGTAANFEKVYGEGGSFRTQGWKPEVITPGPNHTAAQPDFLLRVREYPSDQLDEEGTVVFRDKLFLRPVRMVLTGDNSQWRVMQWGRVK